MKARTYLLPIALAMASIGTVLLLSALQDAVPVAATIYDWLASPMARRVAVALVFLGAATAVINRTNSKG